MKKILIAIACSQIIGCASLKYPNWEQVSIEQSVINKPCESKLRLAEHCNDDDCNTWFKKRATIYNANTVVRHKNNYASYFYCAAGLLPYQNPVAEKPKKTEELNAIQPTSGEILSKQQTISIPPNSIQIQKDTSNGAVPSAQNLNDISEKLKKLKELKDLGILTNSEYESKRKILADRL